MKKPMLLLIAALVAVVSFNPALAGPGIVNPAFVGTGTGAASRTFTNKARNIISIRDYGAIPNDGIDDSAAFMKVASLLSAGIIGGVTLPSGVYNYTSSTRFDVNGAPFPFTIKGDGGAKVVFAIGTDPRPFVIRNTGDFVLSGITFESQNTAVASNCVDLMNVHDVVVENNTFKACTFYGLDVVQDVIGRTDAPCDNVTVRFNKFIDVGLIGFEEFPKVKSKVTEVYGNEFFNVGHNTIGLPGIGSALKVGSGYESASVHDNIIYSAPGYGIAVACVESLELYSNQVYNAGVIAIALTVSDHSYPYSAEFKQTTIRDNKIVYSPGFSPSGPAININGARTNNGPVLLLRNRIFGGTQTAIQFAPQGNMPNVRILGNEIYGSTGALPIRVSNHAGGVPTKPEVSDNVVVNYNLAVGTYDLDFTGAASPLVKRNRLYNMGTTAMQFTSCTGAVVVEDNIINGYNVNNSSSLGAFNVTDSGATSYYVRRNKVSTGNGHPKAVYSGNNATPSVYMDGNSTDDTAVTVTSNSTPTVIETGALPFVQYGKRRQFYGTAAPVSGGVYQTGDVVLNTAVVAGGPLGWVCTNGGSPGTWKAMTNVAP